jgi:hypothetical protein
MIRAISLIDDEVHRNRIGVYDVKVEFEATDRAVYVRLMPQVKNHPFIEWAFDSHIDLLLLKKAGKEAERILMEKPP